MFEKSDWKKGADAISVHHSNRQVDIYDVVIVSVGPRWVNVERKEGRASPDRFDHTGKQDSSFGYAARLWPSREAYEANVARQRAWDRLKKAVNGWSPPDHLSAEEIDGMTAALSPED